MKANAVRGDGGAESPSNISALRCSTIAAFFLPGPTWPAYRLQSVRRIHMLCGIHHVRDDVF